MHAEDQAATKITVPIGDEEYRDDATVDLDSDGVDDTALVVHDDGSALAYTDSDGDQQADVLTALDPHGTRVGEARYDPTAGRWMHTSGSLTDPRALVGGGQLRIDTPLGTQEVGPASHDTDGDGVPDTVLVTQPGGSSVLYTDVDGDGSAEIATEITSLGEVMVSEHAGDGQWTVVDRGHLADDGSYQRVVGRAEDVSTGFGSPPARGPGLGVAKRLGVAKSADELRRTGPQATQVPRSVHDTAQRGLLVMDSSDNSGGYVPPGIDTSVAHSARVWNYWLGGKDNYPVDREAADRYRALRPDIIDVARAVRAFLFRAVRYLAGDIGIRQFLDIGTGLPTANNTHEIAQCTAPECRIVYVDNDPLVLVHARALLTSSPEGATDYLEADVRDPEKILREATRTLDFTQPVALILLGVMEHVLDAEEPHLIVRRLLDTLPSGSYLVLADPTAEVVGEAVLESMRRWNESGGTPPLVARSRQEIARFFEGLELLDPGLVSVSLWRPNPSDVGSPIKVNTFGGVGRKP